MSACVVPVLVMGFVVQGLLASTAWYASDAISIHPEPPRAQEPTEICVELDNPTTVGFDVLVEFGVAHLAIAADHSVIAQHPVHLPARSTVRDCVTWVPPDAGPWSVQTRVVRTGYDDIVSERNLRFEEELLPRVSTMIPVVVRNPTAGPATITLGFVPRLQGWGLEFSQDVLPNVPAGATRTVAATLTPAPVVPPGEAIVTDVIAQIGAIDLGGLRILHRSASVCDGTRMTVAPDLATLNSSVAYQERGAFVSAIGGLHLCTLGMEVDLQVPQVVTARIYEASGTTRGALLYENTEIATASGHVFHSVPVDFELLPCRDYDLAFDFGPAFDFTWFDERTGVGPYDLGGRLRVRDGEYAGDASNFALPMLTLVGTPTGDAAIVELAPEGTTWSATEAGEGEIGVILVAHHTQALTALAWQAELATLPATLHAEIYEHEGGVRGALVARGTTTVTTAAAGLHAIPIATVLGEGRTFELVVRFPTANWETTSESSIPLPFVAAEEIEVIDAQRDANPSHPSLPHLVVRTQPGAGALVFDLGRGEPSVPPPFTSLESNDAYGMFVRTPLPQELYSVGWEADVKVGTTLVARLHEATGTTRGALVAEGSIVSVRGGTRWHDVPLSASLDPGGEYEISIAFGAMNAWSFWEDDDLPYSAPGSLEVYGSSHAGAAGGGRLVHLRVNACNPTATSVRAPPMSDSRFVFDLPSPNPIRGPVTLHYELGAPGLLSIAVYDVAGRRVALVLDHAYVHAGSGTLAMDLRNLAAGVYLVRMECGGRSASRKIVVLQ